MTRGMKVAAWRAFLLANWAVIGWFWYRGLGGGFSLGAASVAIALGRLAGLAAAFMFLQQFFFMGRLPWLERVFGLDKLSELHRKNAKWGMTALLLHPFLLIFGYAALGSTPIFEEINVLVFGQWETILALVAFALFIGVFATSIVIVRKRLKYENWYLVHVAAYAALGASIFHQFAVGSDLLADRIFYGYWSALYIAVAANHLAFRFIRTLWRLRRHEFRVSRVVRENHNVVSVYISGKGMRRFPARPGQFLKLRFLSKRLWRESHPFSLSMVPDGKEIRVTVKELGDFTRKVAHIPVGTRVMIDGPYGIFTDASRLTKKVLFIAGGIGITPIRSLMEESLSRGVDAVLLYGNRSEADIVFHDEFRAVLRKRGGGMMHILSHQDDGHHYEKGQIDREKILHAAPDVRERDVFLCGPALMMKKLIPVLRSLGVPEERLHYEKFALG